MDEKLLILDGVVCVLLAEIRWLETKFIIDYEGFYTSVGALCETLENGGYLYDSVALEHRAGFLEIHACVVGIRNKIMEGER